jgi:hypothetical protein
MQYAYTTYILVYSFIQAKGQTSCYWWIPKDLFILVFIEHIGQAYAYTTYILYIGYLNLIFLYIDTLNQIIIYMEILIGTILSSGL